MRGAIIIDIVSDNWRQLEVLLIICVAIWDNNHSELNYWSILAPPSTIDRLLCRLSRRFSHRENESTHLWAFGRWNVLKWLLASCSNGEPTKFYWLWITSTKWNVRRTHYGIIRFLFVNSIAQSISVQSPLSNRFCISNLRPMTWMDSIPVRCQRLMSRVKRYLSIEVKPIKQNINPCDIQQEWRNLLKIQGNLWWMSDQLFFYIWQTKICHRNGSLSQILSLLSIIRMINIIPSAYPP